jgi:excisionase family DNA binding protein
MARFIHMTSEADLTQEDEWLSLGKAAEMLGVHTMTLRRWSDSGRFPSYRTAGGHRRFALKDILAFIEHGREATDSDKAVATEAEADAAWADTALVQTRELVGREDQQQWLSQMGHNLMGLLLQYVAADETNGTFLDEAERIGRWYGEIGHRAGLSLTLILEATLFFRDILIESTMLVPAKATVEPEANLRILRRVNQIINTVQLAITDYYEFSQRPVENGEKPRHS